MENPRVSLELNELHHRHSSLEVSPRMTSPSPDRLSLNPGSQLHPVDRGRDAWLFLAAATMMEILVWGTPFSVGILHNYWTSTLFPDPKDETILSVAATCMTGVAYLIAPGCSAVLARWPNALVPIQLFGLIGGSVGLIASAFVTKPWHLILTLGICFPMSAYLYLPAAYLLFEWFVERRGIASGIMYGGTGVGGAVIPFLMTALLNRFGYKASMVALGVGFAILGLLAIPFIKRRIPVPKSNKAALHGRKPVNRSFLRRSPFYCFIGSIFFSSLSSFLPSVWIPTYAQEVNSKPDGTALLAIMNAASVPGLLILGALTDRFPLRAVISLSMFGATLSCVFLWGFAGTNSAVLIVFCVCFGALSLAFPAVWVAMVTVIVQDDASLPGLIFSLFHVSRGIPNLLSGPISSALLKSELFKGSIGSYGLHNFGLLLMYTGICLLVGSVCGVSYRVKK